MNPHARKWPVRVAVAIGLLAIANALVAVWESGTRPGQTYRWVCVETGSELAHTPSQFGSTRLTGPELHPGLHYRWTRVEPARLSLWRPWNWLAVLTESPGPDPETIRATAMFK